MEKKTESAIDLIYKMDERFSKLEISVKMLDDKLNAILRIVGDPEKKMKEKVFMKGEIEKAKGPVTVIADAVASQSIEAEEVMEISSKAPRTLRNQNTTAAIVVPSPKPVEISALPKTQPAPNTVPNIAMERVAVDPFNVAEAQEKVTCIVRGKYDSRHGNISNVAVCVKDFSDKIIKNTKTNATGDWLALLTTGEYVVEFSRIAQAPIVKTISILPGKKEMEILI